MITSYIYVIETPVRLSNPEVRNFQAEVITYSQVLRYGDWKSGAIVSSGFSPEKAIETLRSVVTDLYPEINFDSLPVVFRKFS